MSQARPLPPQDPAALTGYLRRIKHVGARRAEELVARFGPEQVLDVIDADPEHAFAQVGLRAARAQEAAESWQTLRVTRRLHLLLAPHGLAYLASRIHEHYGDRRPPDPQPTTPTGSPASSGSASPSPTGSRAPRARPPDPAKRERAAIMHVLAEAERGGSTCLPAPALLAEAGELLSAEVDEAQHRDARGRGPRGA